MPNQTADVAPMHSGRGSTKVPELLGEGSGRVTARRTLDFGEVEVGIAGTGRLGQGDVDGVGVLAFRGTLRAFRGELSVVFTDDRGLPVGRLSGAQVGRRFGRSAHLRGVGVLAWGSDTSHEAAFVVIDVFAPDLRTYRYRVFALEAHVPQTPPLAAR